jgi:glutaminase
VQSCSKAISYCIALEEKGTEEVHNHVGREPSGVSFNKTVLNPDGLPHNPMINAGAIMTISLIQNKLPIYQRFGYIKNFWSNLAAGDEIGFQNATYLGERSTASRNNALAHMMLDSDAFPKGTDKEDTLNLYF